MLGMQGNRSTGFFLRPPSTVYQAVTDGRALWKCDNSPLRWFFRAQGCRTLALAHFPLPVFLPAELHLMNCGLREDGRGKNGKPEIAEFRMNNSNACFFHLMR
jgi:hypothetical protein